MPPDYQNLFTTYSNVELLKILRQPDHYQPEAIETARQILEAREITSEDDSATNQYFEQESARQEKINSFKQKAQDILQPEGSSRVPSANENLYRTFMILTGLLYGWMITSSAITIFKTIRLIAGCREHSFSGNEQATYSDCISHYTNVIFFITSVLPVLLLPILLFLLYKKKKAGWIAMYAERLFSLIMIVSQLYFFIGYRPLQKGFLVTFAWEILYSFSIVYFASQSRIITEFKVSKELRNKVMQYTIAFSVLFILTMLVIFK